MTWSTLGSPLLQTGDTGALLAGRQRNLFTGQTADSQVACYKMKCKHTPSASPNRALRVSREIASYSQTSQVCVYFAALGSCWLWLLLWVVCSLNNSGENDSLEWNKSCSHLCPLLSFSDWNFNTKMFSHCRIHITISLKLSNSPTVFNFSCWL